MPAGSTGWELSVADNPGKPNRDPGLCCKLMPMSGIEKRMARYPQLYSPVEFAHQYRRLGLP